MTIGDEHARPPGAELVEVDGIPVAPPLTAPQARNLATAGVLAGELVDLGRVWSRLQMMWADTVQRGRSQVGEGRLDERVNGEWSFIETLRHLVFVTDLWIGTGVLGLDTFHPLGLPPDFVTNGRQLGLDLDARPDLDTVLAPRRGRQQMVETALATTTDEQLDVSCLGRLSGFTRRGAFQNVMAEEWSHHGFAVRDLASLDDT